MAINEQKKKFVLALFTKEAWAFFFWNLIFLIHLFVVKIEEEKKQRKKNENHCPPSPFTFTFSLWWFSILFAQKKQVAFSKKWMPHALGEWGGQYIALFDAVQNLKKKKKKCPSPEKDIYQHINNAIMEDAFAKGPIPTPNTVLVHKQMSRSNCNDPCSYSI